MMCILQSMKAMKDSQQQQEYISIIDAASVAALHIADNTTVQALLYVAMSEDRSRKRHRVYLAGWFPPPFIRVIHAQWMIDTQKVKKN